MGAPYGNRNAEKWSFKKAVQLYKDAIELSNKKDTYTVRDKNGKAVDTYEYFEFDFIGEIARELGTYHQMITQHLPNRFPVLKRSLNQLLNNLESNCYINGKKGYIKEASAIMNLKSNHKWTDRQDLTTDSKPITKPLTDEEFAERLKKAKDILNE